VGGLSIHPVLVYPHITNDLIWCGTQESAKRGVRHRFWGAQTLEASEALYEGSLPVLGLSALQLPSPHVTHLLFLDDHATIRLEQALRILAKKAEAVRGLLCVNGTKEEVRTEGVSSVCCGGVRTTEGCGGAPQCRVLRRFSLGCLQVLDKTMQALENLWPVIAFHGVGGASHDVSRPGLSTAEPDAWILGIR
jgi:hypothetical protein